MKGIRSGVAAVIALASVSCDSQETLYPVYGRVTCKGSPAVGAVVYLQRPEAGANAPLILGIVQQDGSFELTTGSQGQGAPAGDYVVLIEWKRVPGRGKQRLQTGPDRLQGRYADARSPRFRATVAGPATTLPAFEVGDAAAPRPR